VNSGVGGRICGEAAEKSARRIEWVLEVFCLEKKLLGLRMGIKVG
jgi:hypothetical protein